MPQLAVPMPVKSEKLPVPPKVQEQTVVNTSNKKPKRAANKRTLTSKELMSMHFETVQFDEGWENFLPNATKRMNLGISGGPKNGKTAGACQFAAYLTKFGKVLYNFADQGIIKNTQDLWKLAGLDTNPNAEASDFNTLEDLDTVCASGEFQYIFIDLINSYIDRTKIKPHEFEDRYIKKYPDISFILMFEVTKQGKFKGDQKWMHIVDQIVAVKDYLMETRGRYGNGYHIVWEQEFKKLNPKKYEELILSNEVQKPTVLYL
jgi:predicted ATP-dependent serine protease